MVVEHKLDSRLLTILQNEMEVPPGAIYPVNGPLDLGFLGKLANLSGCDHLRFPVCTSQYTCYPQGGRRYFRHHLPPGYPAAPSL